MTTLRTATSASILLVAVLVAACGGGLDPRPTVSATPSNQASPSPAASGSPSSEPSSSPSAEPSLEPSEEPSTEPSEEPSTEPSAGPSSAPSPTAPAEGSTAVFWIDPAALPLDPAATSFKAFVRETTCASGKSPNGRISIGSIRYTKTTVTIRVDVAPRPGPQDCQGNPAFPVTITTSQPLGARQILDAGSDPPRDATTIPG